MDKIFDVLKRNAKKIDIVDKNCLEYNEKPFYEIIIFNGVSKDDLEIINDNISEVGMIAYLTRDFTRLSKDYLENLEESLNNLNIKNTTKKQALYLAFLEQQDSYTHESFPFKKVRNLNNKNKEETSYLIKLFETSADRNSISVSRYVRIVNQD